MADILGITQNDARVKMHRVQEKNLLLFISCRLMELDDPRRQWQQPETMPPPVNPAQFESLLAYRSTSLIEKMRRNAWVEAVLNALVAVMLPFYIATRQSALYRMDGCWHC